MSLQGQLEEVLAEIGRDIKGAQSPSSAGEVYSPAAHLEHFEGGFFFSVWPRIDGTAYLAQRVEVATGEVLTFSAPLPLPAVSELSTLNFS